MASSALAAVELPQEEQLTDFLLIRADEIDAGDRLRPIDPVWAEALGQMMARDGQDVPIQVCRLPGRSRWTLVAGGHRHAGALSAGIEMLRAEHVSADRNMRRAREVRENLWRRDLDPLDRAAFMAELVSIKRASAGLDQASDRAGKVNERWKAAVGAEADVMLETISSTYGWTEEVGEQIGVTGRTIRNDLMLFRRIAPSMVEALRKVRHPVLKNASQLKALAKLEGRVQIEAVDALVGDNGWEAVSTVAEAVKRTQGDSGKPVPAADQKRLSTILGTLARMSDRERVALFQSPAFHDAIPAEARQLLAPMRREPSKGARV